MSVPEDTPEGASQERPPARPPGWRKATPDKFGSRRPTPAPARPAARAPARPPAPPGERPPARPPARRPADDTRPYLPPMPEHAVTAAAPPTTAAPKAPAPASGVESAQPAPPSTPPSTPPPSPPASAPAGPSRAELRAATARPHARPTGTTPTTPTTPTARPVPAATPRPAEGLDRLTASEGEGWLVLLLLAATGIVAVRLAPDLPDLLREGCAVVVSAALAWGLAIRTGGRPFWAAGLSSVLAIAAVVSDWHPLVAGAAVGTGVMGATLAVMATTPAATFLLALRESLLATAVAAIGAIGVVGYGVDQDPEVDAERFGYAVLVLALVGALALVYRLGAGLHGLGRRGYVVAGGAVVMLVFALAYSEAIAHWGSRDLVGTADDFRDSVRAHLGAVPHPIVALLGYPALVWGVFMRARRRQGWWVCAFGVAATAPIASRLVSADVGARSVVLGGVYSFVIGAAVGYLVIRLEQSLTGSHGRRARRDEEAEAHRPEPRRTRPLH